MSGGGGGPLGMGGSNQIAMSSGSGYGDPYYLREKEREREQRERERERERMGDRERERERGGDLRDHERDRDRERDREIRERERERERDPRERDLRDRDIRERERERERLADQRDPKRLKSERRPDPFSPNIASGHSHLGPGASGPTPKLPPPPSSQGPNAAAAAAAAAVAGGMGPGLPPPPSLHGGTPGYGTTGPGGSSQHGGGDNPNASNSLGLIPLNTSGPSASSGIPPGPGSALGPIGGGALPLAATGTTTNFPEEFDVHNIPSEFKKEGNDWFAIFNPKVKRVLDVNLVHTLMHERCVCFGSGFILPERKADCSFVPIASYVVSDFPRMGNIWLRAVTVQRRYMIRRRVKKPGGSFFPSSLVGHILFLSSSSLLLFP